MGVLCDYFTAPSDLEAGTTINWPAARPSHLATPWITSVSMNGVDPVVMMGTLDELLTGRTFSEVLADTSGYEVAIRDEGERLVWRLPTALRDGLGSADEETLRAVAVDSGTDRGVRRNDSGRRRRRRACSSVLVPAGREHDRHLYCWLCV